MKGNGITNNTNVYYVRTHVKQLSQMIRRYNHKRKEFRLRDSFFSILSNIHFHSSNLYQRIEKIVSLFIQVFI